MNIEYGKGKAEFISAQIKTKYGKKKKKKITNIPRKTKKNE